MAFINHADKEYLKKINLITKKRLHHSLSGPQISARRGYGLEFDQLRSYESGDDIRFVDWKASARSTQGLMIKQYLHDYTKNIVIVLDVSASMNYTSHGTSLFECAQRLAILIAYVAEYTKAPCRVIVFDQEIVNHLPACVAHKAELIVELSPSNQRSNFTQLAQSLAGYKLKNSLLFIISDFIGCNAFDALHALQTEIIALRVNAPLLGSYEHSFYMHTHDNEEQSTHFLSSAHSGILAGRIVEQNTLLRRYNIAYKDFFCNASSYKELTDMLITFFNKNVQLYC